jgi:hypothetical protein
MADDDKAKGRAADALNQQGEIDDVTDAAWDFEVAFDVNGREAISAAHDQLSVLKAQFFGIPVFDQPIEHVEVTREIDDAGRIAMREPDWDTARKRARWWRKTILMHAAMSW